MGVKEDFIDAVDRITEMHTEAFNVSCCCGGGDGGGGCGGGGSTTVG